MFLKVKRLTKDAKLPQKRFDDAGYDLYSVEDVEILPHCRVSIKTGIAMEIPEFHCGLIWPRSGLAVKNGVDNLAGVIDPSYRGELIVCLLNTSNDPISFKVGDKIAQIIIQKYESPKVIECTELSISERGENGFGSNYQNS